MENGSNWAMVTTAKLTKKLLMSLEEHHYLSNSMNGGIREQVAPLKAREAQWMRIKSAHSDGKKCCVWDTTKRGAEPTERYGLGNKVSKAFLMSLHEGVTIWITSTGFKEAVAPTDQRELQWERIKASGGAGRACMLIQSLDS
jgi:hypothetical protein